MLLRVIIVSSLCGVALAMDASDIAGQVDHFWSFMDEDGDGSIDVDEF